MSAIQDLLLITSGTFTSNVFKTMCQMLSITYELNFNTQLTMKQHIVHVHLCIKIIYPLWSIYIAIATICITDNLETVMYNIYYNLFFSVEQSSVRMSSMVSKTLECQKWNTYHETRDFPSLLYKVTVINLVSVFSWHIVVVQPNIWYPLNTFIRNYHNSGWCQDPPTQVCTHI